MSPRVSIGLPVYNGERFLSKTLDSLLGQTFEDLELLISDNASTDSTEQICRDYATRDSRILYHRNETNLGSVPNFNSLVGRARGEYFKWSADDDICDPGMLARCLETLQTNEKAILAYPQVMIIDEHDQATDATEPYDLLQELADASPRVRLRRMVLSMRYHPIFGLMRTEMLRRTPLMKSHFGSDYTMLMDLLMTGPFLQVPEPLLRIRIHPDCFGSRAGVLARSGGHPAGQIAQWWDTNLKGRVAWHYWRRWFEYNRAVLGADAGIGERAMMLGFLIKLAYWWRGNLAAEAANAVRQMLRRSNGQTNAASDAAN